MPTSIDSLQIDIIAQSNKADVAIDRLVSKLDKLSNSLGKIPVGSISSLASGVDKLGRAMQVMSSVDSRTFTRLANNINKLSQVNVASINTASSSIQRLSKSLNILGSTSSNAQGVVQLSSALGRLGGKSVSNAIVNIPLLATAMNELMVTLSKSPIVSRNVIDLANALANLAHNGKRVGTASRSVTSGLHNTRKSMESTSRSATSLAATFGRLYANYFLLIRGAKAFVNAIKGTSDYIEAFNYYNVAFGKIASEWDKDWEKYGYDNAEVYAESFTKRMQESLSKMSGLEVVIDADGKGLLTSTNLQNLGLNIREITQYASQLASVTNSVGQTGEVSLAAARSFTKLGADISSLFNIDYSDAMANLQSGLIGQSRALYKYGIDITNATLQTYAFELGLNKSVSEMTQAEKMQLRMVAILDQSKVAWGDLANTINSPSNMLRQFANNVKEVGMVLGQLFIPLMERVMPVVNGATIAIKNFLVNIASLLGINIDFDAFGEGFTDLGDGAEELSDGLDDLSSSAKKVTAGLRKFDELNNISLPSASGNGSSLGSSIDLTEEILKATEEYEKVWNEAFAKMESKAQTFAKKFSKILKPLENIFKKIKIGDWFGVGQDTSKLIKSIFDYFSKAIKRVDWEKIGRNIAEFLDGLNWTEILLTYGNFLITLTSAAIDLFGSSFKAEPIATTIVSGLALAKFTGLGKIIGGAFKKAILGSAFATSIIAAFAALGGIGGILTADLGVVLGTRSLALIGVTLATGLASAILTGIIGFALGEKISVAIWPENQKYIEMSWNEQWKNIFDSFKDGTFIEAFKLIGDDIVDCFQSAWDRIKEGWTNLAIEFSKWQVQSGIDLKDFIQITPLVPGYATGGFPEDGLFMANHNELVGRFSNGKTAVANNGQITQGIADAVYPAVYNAVLAASNSSQGSGNKLKIEGDPRGMFTVFVEEWENETRRTQRNPVTIYDS